MTRSGPVRAAISTALRRGSLALYARGLRSTASLTLPHFLGLGPGQSGSTWLHRALAAHPDVFMYPHKEAHYFDRGCTSVPLSHYAAQFFPGRERRRGEISPGYSVLSRRRIRLAHALLPDARLLLVVRNPIARSWSAARRVMPRLGTTLDAIPRAQLFEYLRQEWAYRPPDGQTLKGEYEPGVLEGHYTRCIANWLEHYDASQLRVLLFDELEAQPASFLRKACEHVGADPAFEWPAATLERAVNANPPHPMPRPVFEFLAELYRDEIERLARRFDAPAARWLKAPEGV